MRKLITFTTLILTLMLVGCVAQNPSSERATQDTENSTGGDTDTDGGGSSGSGTGSTDSGDDDVDSTVVQALGKVEITQVVDPNTDTFRKKISIAKDFDGYLHLSGLNIAALKENIVKVRFTFGRDRSPIVLDQVVIGRVPDGLTPLSSIDVLSIDMSSKPFRNIRLSYDLFDYNDYNGDTEEPTDDPTDAGLYCRGLLVEDDTTFNTDSLGQDGLCDDAGETCLYSFVSIKDATLYQELSDDDGNTSLVSNIPSYEQIDIEGNGYSSDSSEYQFLKCLPDSIDGDLINDVVGFSSSDTVFSSSVAFGNSATYASSGELYYWQSPFSLFSESDWEVSGDALFSEITSSDVEPTGIFQHQIISNYGYKSFLFPRAVKLSYSTSGTQYYGSNSIFGERSLQSLSSAGDTLWMDGCNLRAKQFDSYTQETISSCNVTANIEIIAVTNNEEEVLVESADVKIQLLKAGTGETEGSIFSAMKSCVDSRGCGAGECCFNSRCWDDDLIGQCTEDFTATGNLGTGDSCSSDLACASLCCDEGAGGVCKDHIYNGDEDDVLCSKSPSQSCVAQEFCRQDNVRECYVITTVDADGNDSCEKKCYSVPQFGNCIEGKCQAADVPSEPDFDPTDPDRCNPDNGSYTIYDSPPIILTD